ncbi:alpha-1,3-arabinosyltransferase XAT3-like [Typha angustifolia]|uniref:alpha-1,3-arabinosyltransferase XAT3-like n=1 Tax=Typha angustifolia TaxID=59011 RepID=UPI003C2F2887
MGDKSKLVRNLRVESQRFRLLVIVIGCFLVTLTFIVVSKPEAILFTSSSTKLSLDESLPDFTDTETITHQDPSEDSEAGIEVEESKPKWSNNEAEQKIEDVPKHKLTLPTVSNYTIKDSDQEEKTFELDQPGTKREAEEKSDQCNDPGSCVDKEKHKVTLPTVSNYTINESDQVELTETKQPESEREETAESRQPGMKLEMKQLCDFSDFRSNICEMDGDIRIQPKSSSILFMESSDSQRDELWKIKPYPRKGDEFCLSHVTELTVKSSKEAPQCTKYHNVPALVFSISGYTGNLFHDFTDVMVPLFTTANQFNGEVQFLLTDMHPWWVIKYEKVLQKLSNYPVIDFSKDDQVHCFKHAIVGLRAYKEFTIDSSKSPNGYSMIDFNRFMRRAFSLEREATTVVGEVPNKKPRLLIISRKRTRAFTNLNEIAAMAEDLGYEVVINEADVGSDISKFAEIVNSCDVMMGVHGAGLTNCVFLPPNATLIQIVPWGGLDWIARLDFGDPANAMGIRYSQYSITVDESTLLEQYPRDHEIFTNPFAFHKRGFDFIRKTFMDQQNVKLDVRRFRSVLLEALDHLHS